MTYEAFARKNSSVKSSLKESPFTNVLTISSTDKDNIIFTNGISCNIKLLIQGVLNGQGCVSNPSKLARLKFWDVVQTNSNDFEKFNKAFNTVMINDKNNRMSESERLMKEYELVKAEYDKKYKGRIVTCLDSVRSWSKAFELTGLGIDPATTFRNIGYRYKDDRYKDGRPRVGLGVTYYCKNVLSHYTVYNMKNEPNSVGNVLDYGLCISVNCDGTSNKYSKAQGWANTDTSYTEARYRFWVNQRGLVWCVDGEGKMLSQDTEVALRHNRALVNFYKAIMMDYDAFEKDLLSDMHTAMER